jgi:hypothetical protein
MSTTIVIVLPARGFSAGSGLPLSKRKNARYKTRYEIRGHESRVTEWQMIG